MPAAAPARPGFSLQLERGAGRLVLTDRVVAGLLRVETLALSLDQVPGRLDLRVGADRFRHQRTRLDTLAVAIDEEALGAALSEAAQGTPFQDLDVRLTEGDVVITGALATPTPTPFLCRIRPVPAGVAGERVLLISAYETRIYGPASLSGPQVARGLLQLLGLGPWLRGPTLAALDPVQLLVLEICASLGWKVPDRREVRVDAVRCEAGRLHLVAQRNREASAPGPRPLGDPAPSRASEVRDRRFLADYEAKGLFAAIEARLGEGDPDAVLRALRRQLEIHPGHGFLIGRLLQVGAAWPEAAAEVRALASTRLARFPEDADALLALATVRARAGATDEAAELLERVGELARRQGDELQATQAAWAAAAARQARSPRAAIAAYEQVLRTRHRLAGVLRALVDLYLRVGDQAAALRIQQRLVAASAGPAERRRHLLRMGEMAVAGQPDLARQAFEGILADDPDDVEALDGVAAAATRQADHLAAIQTLDRAARLLRGRGDVEAAAVRVTRLGDLWATLPEGAATAHLRYRQALLLAPRHIPALLGLAELARLEGDAPGARARYEEILRQPGEGIDRAEVHLRLGLLLAASPGEEGLAAAHLQKALEGSAPQVEAALEALERLHRAAGRQDDVARVLTLAAARATEPAVRSERLVRLAQVHLRDLADAPAAVRLLREAGRLDPENPTIPAVLADLHRQAGDHAALAGVLAELAERVDDPARLAALYVERGDLLRLHLNRADDAAAAYALALGCQPESREALAGLADVYRAQERSAELAEALGRLARLEPDARDAGLLWLELGRLQARVLERPEAAITAFEAALAALPDDAEALRALGDLHYDAGRHEAALVRYARLAELYAEEGYDEPSAPFLRRLAAAQAAVGRADEALTTLEEAVREDPDDVATCEQAQDLLLRTGDVERIAWFFQQALAGARRPAARAFLARRAGRVLWRELRRPAEAAPLLDVALAADPGDVDVMRIRLEVATALGDWPTVAGLLRGQLQVATAARRPGLLVRLARLAASELHAEDEARRLAQAALEERPDYEPAQALLAELGAGEAVAEAVDRRGADARAGAGRGAARAGGRGRRRPSPGRPRRPWSSRRPSPRRRRRPSRRRPSRRPCPRRRRPLRARRRCRGCARCPRPGDAAAVRSAGGPGAGRAVERGARFQQ
ncbi:MAG: hypothetical protein H6706_01680 [Myxococcales bacterium]|nr:hypothetical protein [Myxococcales bacterium]